MGETHAAAQPSGVPFPRAASEAQGRILSIEFHDDGPDREDRRHFCLRFVNDGGRKRAQEFRSAQWRELLAVIEASHG